MFFYLDETQYTQKLDNMKEGTGVLELLLFIITFEYNYQKPWSQDKS